MAKTKGLGRGLDALLGEETTAPSREKLTTLPVLMLQPGKYQPRTHMDAESLQHLAESIRSQGIMQPILVREVSADRFEIIAGERRWRAAQLAGLSEVPVVVREVPDEAALAMSLIENIQRENLNPLEEAAGLQRLIDEFGMTHQAASEAVGRSRSAVTNLLRLLNLAKPVQAMVMESRIDMGHARALLSLSGAKQIEAAEVVASKALSVREAERLVQRMLKPTPPPPKTPDRDVVRLQEDLSDRIGAKVSIKMGTKGKGKLTIEYGSLEELDSIISRF